jgi:shikimate dehydrogenase
MTTRVGVIGWPLDHSISPALHNAAFRALGLDWHYDKMAIPPDILRQGLAEPQRHGYIGLNVTIPHKEAVLKFATPDDVARAVGAANTIDLRTNQATNTDVAGLIEDLQAHHVPIEGARILVLGAGGAARAAVCGLARSGGSVTIVNRTLERARVMLANLALSAGIRDVDAITLDEAAEQRVDVIVNCTSAGMWPHSADSPWVDGVPFPRGVTLYEMIYRPAVTALMKQAEDAGGRAIGGLGMLVRQGAASFRIWTGIDPPLEVMFQAARDALREDQR